MSSDPRRPLGRTGFLCHPIGFGCYRIAEGEPGHEAALRAYLERGGNLIDTSANYTDGLSEKLVGRVLKDRSRESVFVVTKGGYIQGQNMTLALSRKFPDVVTYAEGLWHCIHPDFLETQIQRSMERMQIQTIDAFLLHNPEYFLTEIAHRHPPTPADHAEFYRRIDGAFRFLEEQARAGRIRWYGVSSNHFGLDEKDPAMTSVSRCLVIAKTISADHRFNVVQLPLNLYEGGGALAPNNNGRTVLEFCRENRIGVLANRPLNAFSNNRMIRLADFVPAGTTPPGPSDFSAGLEPLKRHERLFAETFGASEHDTVETSDLFERLIVQLQSPAHLEQVLGQYLIDPIREWLAGANRELGNRPEWMVWQRTFVELINRSIEESGRYLAAQQQSGSDEVRSRLIRAGYPQENAESLSQMAVRILLGLPGLSCTLVGMRRPEYVADLMGLPSKPPLSSLETIGRFQSS